MTDEQRLLTVKELADIIGVGPHAVYKMVYTGRLRHYRQGRAIRVTLADYRASLEVVEAGQYRPDPKRSQAALRRWARRKDTEPTTAKAGGQ